jgi:hypothetical protein
MPQYLSLPPRQLTVVRLEPTFAVPHGSDFSEKQLPYYSSVSKA